MSGSTEPVGAIHGFERAYLEKFRLAAQVILEAAPDGSLVSDPLEAELGIFKDRVEFMLLIPEAAATELSWRDGRVSRANGDGPPEVEELSARVTKLEAWVGAAMRALARMQVEPVLCELERAFKGDPKGDQAS